MSASPQPRARAAARRSRETREEARQRRAAVDDEAVVMEAAAMFLGVRPRSIEETRRRLLHLGYRPPIVEVVVRRLVEVGYLDDEQFARAWVESRDRVRPRGVSALRRELTLKGVGREVIEAILADRVAQHPATAPDRAAAVALLERRRAALEREADPRRRRQKAYALLARNGFDPETAASAASTVADVSS